jgi:hypothetical protein
MTEHKSVSEELVHRDIEELRKNEEAIKSLGRGIMTEHNKELEEIKQLVIKDLEGYSEVDFPDAKGKEMIGINIASALISAGYVKMGKMYCPDEDRESDCGEECSCKERPISKVQAFRLRCIGIVEKRKSVITMDDMIPVKICNFSDKDEIRLDEKSFSVSKTELNKFLDIIISEMSAISEIEGVGK